MRLPILLAIALLVLPTALASWSSSTTGVLEPSTIHDRAAMWSDPPTSGAERVYFDVVYTRTSQFELLPHYEAHLGLWRDCNGDGVIGGPTGDAYPAALLTLASLSVCPPGSPHNDGSTVRELLWIGPGAHTGDINDPDAAVWLDDELPEEPVTPVKTATDDVFSFDPNGPRWVGTTIWPTEPAHVTAYAHVGQTTLARALTPTGRSSYYGAEACRGATTGIHNGWDCDPTHWPSYPRVGDLYEMRDVDCIAGEDC